MKFRKLNFWISGVITVTIIAITLIACNNSDKSAKNSTTTETSNDSLATTKTIAKKKGKVTTTTAENNTANMKMDKMGFYNRTEVAPVFEGGQSSLEDYITNHIVYPEEAVDNNIEGTVNVQFTIDENGKVGNVKTMGNKLGYGLEDAAVQVVLQMPKWTPGKIKDKNVKAWYTLPIVYKMEES
jgi:periplasmic protein TonB